METWTSLLIVVALALLVRAAVKRILNPITFNAAKRVKELKRLRFLAKYLEEGTLLNIYDQNIMELGHAMLMDGVSTSEINVTMLDLLEEELKRTTGMSALRPYGSKLSTYPNYRTASERLRRGINKGWKL